MSEMRAALFDRYGPPEVLYVGSVPIPTIKPDQVLVRVHAASVNGGELAGRAGKLRLITGRTFPQGTGVDFAGEVAAVGASVTGVRVGDRVWGIQRLKVASMAEYVAISPRKISPAPRNLTPAEAISLLAGGTTSLTALRDHAAIKPGERLLVRGASGGVGSVAVQIGKLLGAHVVALAGARNLDFVRGLGADEVLDYRTTPLSQLPSFDVVLDAAGTQQSHLRHLLAPGGRMVAITTDLNRPLASLTTILTSAVHGRGRIRIFSGNPDTQLLTELTQYAENGDVVPVIDTVHTLDGIAAAHRALEAGGVRGKHVIQVV
ncbi:NAD(P)-dependent alcohol dehydrogenase [Streptomyces sp. NBC_00859]|uniref:NAD(P)-dependent alcohol dehydrogenase n=1 Tax=Streptomyces sp. NBC_00859 TaxID=2903682 RepID=UPI00386A347C|nr:NAD(P)-dependent alcohol dehydrogenase [Streptomyces sp. NBC_00859]